MKSYRFYTVKLCKFMFSIFYDILIGFSCVLYVYMYGCMPALSISIFPVWLLTAHKSQRDKPNGCLCVKFGKSESDSLNFMAIVNSKYFFLSNLVINMCIHMFSLFWMTPVKWKLSWAATDCTSLH